MLTALFMNSSFDIKKVDKNVTDYFKVRRAYTYNTGEYKIYLDRLEENYEYVDVRFITIFGNGINDNWVVQKQTTNNDNGSITITFSLCDYLYLLEQRCVLSALPRQVYELTTGALLSSAKPLYEDRYNSTSVFLDSDNASKSYLLSELYKHATRDSFDDLNNSLTTTLNLSASTVTISTGNIFIPEQYTKDFSKLFFNSSPITLTGGQTGAFIVYLTKGIEPNGGWTPAISQIADHSYDSSKYIYLTQYFRSSGSGGEVPLRRKITCTYTSGSSPYFTMNSGSIIIKDIIYHNRENLKINVTNLSNGLRKYIVFRNYNSKKSISEYTLLINPSERLSTDYIFATVTFSASGSLNSASYNNYPYQFIASDSSSIRKLPIKQITSNPITKNAEDAANVTIENKLLKLEDRIYSLGYNYLSIYEELMNNYGICYDSSVTNLKTISDSQLEINFYIPKDRTDVILSDITSGATLNVINNDYSKIITNATVLGEGEGSFQKTGWADTGETGIDRFEEVFTNQEHPWIEGLSAAQYLEHLKKSAEAEISRPKLETDYTLDESLYFKVKPGETIYISSKAVNRGIIHKKIVDELKMEISNGSITYSLTVIEPPVDSETQSTSGTATVEQTSGSTAMAGALTPNYISMRGDVLEFNPFSTGLEVIPVNTTFTLSDIDTKVLRYYLLGEGKRTNKLFALAGGACFPSTNGVFRYFSHLAFAYSLPTIGTPNADIPGWAWFNYTSVRNDTATTELGANTIAIGYQHCRIIVADDTGAELTNYKIKFDIAQRYRYMK